MKIATILVRRIIPVAALTLLPLAASAQQDTEDLEVQQLVTEAQQLQAQLQPVQQRALNDPAIQQEQQEVEDQVRSRIEDADPENAERLDRMEQLLAEAAVAQENGDEQKIAALTSEAQELQPHIQAAQQQALADPGIAERLSIFQENVRMKMIEIDPEAREVLARLSAIEQRLQEIRGS
jgi:hypothetical protein